MHCLNKIVEGKGKKVNICQVFIRFNGNALLPEKRVVVMSPAKFSVVISLLVIIFCEGKKRKIKVK
jgi:hypothetical protein